MGRKFKWFAQTPSVWLLLTSVAITVVTTGINEYRKIKSGEDK